MSLNLFEKIDNGLLNGSKISLEDNSEKSPIINMEPFNVSILNIDKFIKDNNIQKVESSFIFESGSKKNYNPKGLFSEDIFGELGSDDRFVKIGYIDLKTKVFHPKIYKIIIRFKRYYEDIMSGKSFAKFDENVGDFVLCEDSDENASTGYSFFVENFVKIKFNKNNSLSRNDKIKLIEKYKDNLFITKELIMPAAFRDFQLNDYSQEAINKVYNTLLNYTFAMPDKQSDNKIYDIIKYGIQKKVFEIYNYIENMLTGKGGMMQNKYTKRGLALSTRNVIATADTVQHSPNSLQQFKNNETLIPLFEVMKMFQPIVIHYLKSIFFGNIFESITGQVPLVDIKTKTLQYVEVDKTTQEKFISSDGIQKFIDRFRNVEIRNDEIKIVVNKKEYLMYMVYDGGDEIFLLRDKERFKSFYEEEIGKTFIKKNLRGLTYSEMVYIATWLASRDKHCTITRYPVLLTDSIYPSKIHMVTTNPSRIVSWRSHLNKDINYTLPEYPILSKPYIDAISPHPNKLKGLNADFDGDKVSCNGIISKESNKEVDNFLNSKANIIALNGGLSSGLNTKLCKLTLYNMTTE